ncbi:MAG: right-handed parallel beta-helix repeat-containing protein [Deltaproteobacteria bacterium]|nr:right-handed parallel beta-helix repeat-containing protein [Deltaproteobacteria bacterium]
MRICFWILIWSFVLFQLSCSDDNGGGDSGDSATWTDSDTIDNGTSSDSPVDTSLPACDDGVMNGDETGVDCGGTCAVCFVGNVYHVSAEGNDANDGLGEGADHAWRTIAHVNAQSFVPGDAILFRRGDTWREQLLIHSSGAASAYITFGAYGEGDKPRILGSAQAEGWTPVSGAPNVWQSATSLLAPREREGNSTTNHPASIFFGAADGSITFGNMEALHLNSEGAPTDIYQCDESGARFSLLNEEYDWCWQEGSIFVYAPENPQVRYAFVEVPQRSATIEAANHPPAQYIAIDGLELLFALKYGYDDGWPMNVQVRGLNISNCHIGYMGTKGAASAIGLQIWHSDMRVTNNDIHDCGRRNISYNVYGDVRDGALVFENVVFHGNTLHNGYHTTGVDISAGYEDTFRNFEISNNFIWDTPSDDPQNSPNDFTSMGIYLAGEMATFTDFKVHHNILKFTKQKGLILNDVSNSLVANNTFYDMNERAGGDYRGMITVSGEPMNLQIVNNLFYSSVPANALTLSCVTFSGSSQNGVTMNHNLYFHEVATQRIATINSLGSYQMADWTRYQTETGFDTGSPAPANPLLTSPLTDNFTPQAGSPAIDAGMVIAGVTDGFAGAAPDIGAVESGK